MALRMAPGSVERAMALVLILVLAGCAGPATLPASAPDEAPADFVVYVVSNGWHSGIVVPRSALGERVPESADFPDAAWFEFGWGDRDYYPAEDPGVAMALSAALVPTPAVVHLAGFQDLPLRRGPDEETIAVPVSAAGLTRLVTALDRAFDRGGAPRAESVAPGLYPSSLFYPAHGEFHAFNTCNTWVAARLQAARPELDGHGVQTASDLMGRVRALAGAEIVVGS